MKNFIFIGALALTLPATAQGGSNDAPPIWFENGEEFGIIKHSKLNVYDDVEGNCWTNSDTVRSKVYLILEQNGIFVPDYEPAFFGVNTVSTSLSAFGFRNSGGDCVVSAKFESITRVAQNLGGYGGTQRYLVSYTAQLFHRSQVMTSASNVNEQLVDFFDGAASEFTAKILSANRGENVQNYLSDYPHLSDKPISKEEWNEKMNEAKAKSGN